MLVLLALFILLLGVTERVLKGVGIVAVKSSPDYLYSIVWPNWLIMQNLKDVVGVVEGGLKIFVILRGGKDWAAIKIDDIEETTIVLVVAL